MKMKFEEILDRDGILVYRTRGTSMEPMLRQNRDLVVIRPSAARLRRFDAALYRRGEMYVLHRVIRVKDGYYLIRGDNTFALETVPDDAVLGALTEFQRKGKTISAQSRGYRFYVRFWNAIYPLRYLYHGCRRLAVKAARRLGILPLLKKILRRGK